MKGKNLKRIIKFNSLKNHKKIMVSLIVVIAFLGFFLTINYGRYVKNIIEVYYLRTKNFYFNSDKLTINGKKYEIYPWSATEPYYIDIEMNTLLNDLKGTSYDVLYEMTCEVENSYKDKVGCEITNYNGIIEVGDSASGNHHKDFPKIKIEQKNDDALNNGDEFNIKVKAKTNEPYKEELSATFVFKVGNYGIRYVVENTPGNIYFDVIITNTLDDKSVDVSLNIDDTNKVAIDMSNNVLNDKYKEKYNLITSKNQNGDINNISFTLGRKSSMMIRFYKIGYDFDNKKIDQYLKFYTTENVEVVNR